MPPFEEQLSDYDRGFLRAVAERDNLAPVVARLREERDNKLTEPLSWRRGRRVFVNSMSDLFHEALTDAEIDRVLAVMAMCPQHTFQVLTKRAERMRKYLCAADRPAKIQEAYWSLPGAYNWRATWPLENVWLGVSGETGALANARGLVLLDVPAEVKFVSYEPALGPWEMDARLQLGLDWVIVGGESGPGARYFCLEWAREVVEQCDRFDIACFVKQLGARPCDEGKQLKLVDPKGGDMNEWPVELRVRQFPKELVVA